MLIETNIVISREELVDVIKKHIGSSTSYIIPKNDQEMSVHFYTQRDGSFRGVNVILTCER
jgi:hypothetical protein